MQTQTHALVEHVRLVPQGGVLTQVLLDPFDPLHLQLLQLLQREDDQSASGSSSHITSDVTQLFEQSSVCRYQVIRAS